MPFVQHSLISPADTPFPPPWGESIWRTEGDPHFWLLDHIQVLTSDSDDSASTVVKKKFNESSS